MKGKELVTLRIKPLKDGGGSLFLDYSLDGVRYKDYLKMYLVPERKKLDKIQNEQTLKTAQAIKAKKIIAIQDGRAGFRQQSEKDLLLTDYIKQQAESYRRRGHREYAHTLEKIGTWITKFKKRVSLRGVTKEYVLDFVQFLRDSRLADSTIHVYFSNLNSLFNFAYRQGLIVENPMHRIDPTLKPHRPESTREYLTLEEVRTLMATPISCEAVRNAFLFSCFTGLRLSDIESLTWDNIKPTDDGWQVEERQMKTRKIVVIPLSDNALELLPPRGAGDERVWSGLPCRAEIGRRLKNWVAEAGIEKHITFHCARHTNATLLLTYGVDLYTVSSLLGHRHIETTEIYAKVVNAKKVQAVNKIPKI
ncbi:MAG: site-specific integrase [Bacteroidales bacterium]|nr:site-specific integrase [Bacteroidales bacterium]